MWYGQWGLGLNFLAPIYLVSCDLLSWILLMHCALIWWFYVIWSMGFGLNFLAPIYLVSCDLLFLNPFNALCVFFKPKGNWKLCNMKICFLHEFFSQTPFQFTILCILVKSLWIYQGLLSFVKLMNLKQIIWAFKVNVSCLSFCF